MFFILSLLSIKVLCESIHSIEQLIYCSSGWSCRMGPYLAIAASMSERLRGGAIAIALRRIQKCFTYSSSTILLRRGAEIIKGHGGRRNILWCGFSWKYETTPSSAHLTIRPDARHAEVKVLNVSMDAKYRAWWHKAISDHGNENYESQFACNGAKVLSAFSFTAWLLPFSILMTARDLGSATAIATSSQKLITIWIEWICRTEWIIQPNLYFKSLINR